MAAKKKWYQDYRIATPIVVAVVGVIGTWITTHYNDEKPKEPLPTTTAAPPASFALAINVIDDATDNRLAGAKIVSDELGFSKETDDQGRATVSIPSNLSKIRITVSMPKYRTQNVELSVYPEMDAARIRLQPE